VTARRPRLCWLALALGLVALPAAWTLAGPGRALDCGGLALLGVGALAARIAWLQPGPGRLLGWVILLAAIGTLFLPIWQPHAGLRSARHAHTLFEVGHIH
jgi:hypothetical protein